MEFCLPPESQGYEMKFIHSTSATKYGDLKPTVSPLVLIPKLEYSHANNTSSSTTSGTTLNNNNNHCTESASAIIMKRAHSNDREHSEVDDDDSNRPLLLRSSSPTPIPVSHKIKITSTPSTTKSKMINNSTLSCSSSTATSSTTTTNDLKCSTLINNNNNNSNNNISNKFSASTSSKSTSTTTSTSTTIINCSSNNCDVFLGGSCNPTTWRTEIAIPMLKNFGITYYNPQVASWCPELMEAEHRAKDKANVLFFVLDNQTRAVSATLEVAYLVAQGKNVVLVMNGVGQTIMGEPISQAEFEELTCGQLVLQDLVRRHQIPVFTDISNALKCTAKIINDGVPIHDTCHTKDLVTMNFTNSYVNWVTSNLRKTFDSLISDGRNNEISLLDITKAYKNLMHQELHKDKISHILDSIRKRKLEEHENPDPDNKTQLIVNNSKTNINYEEFCCIMTELIYNQKNSMPSSIIATTSKYVRNITAILNKLMECLPSSKSSNVENAKIVNRKGEPKYDVYLGGVACTACAKWREQIAIPALEKQNITFFNPETIGNNKATNFLPLDSTGIEDCKILFFYLSNASRALEVLTMAAYYIGLKREVVLCVENLSEDCKIGSESLSKTAVKDYNRGRSYISDIASRDGILVHDNLSQAIEALIEKCNSTSL